MHILIIVLLVLVGIIALVLIIAVFTKKGYEIECETIVNAPLKQVFDYVKQLKNWDNFNKPAMADPDEKRVFKGTDGTVGFIYAWSGNRKVGEGEKEIRYIAEGEKIETEIRFLKPFALIGQSSMATEAVSGNQTKVTMRNTSTLKYPLNILIPMVEKGIVQDIDTSLSMLKTILEK